MAADLTGRRGQSKPSAVGIALAARALWRASPVLAAAAAGVGVASWGASQILITPTNRGLWRMHRPLRVVDVDQRNGRIMLAGADAHVPGVWGLTWAGGYAQVEAPPPGDYRDSHEPTVTRAFRMLDGTPPARGATVHWDPLVWPDRPDALGLDAQVVPLEGPVCSLPAWRYDGCPGPRPGEDWAIFVHGRKSRRAQAFRALRPLQAAGWTCLTISYRNDDWLPRHGVYGLGSTEWQDLEAAVRYAEEQGARRILLFGFSLGGAIVSMFLRSSSHIDKVVGVVLDSPVLDWEIVLRRLARSVGLPGFLATTALAATSLRTGIDFDQLDHLAHAHHVTQPTLLFHGTDDEQVPLEASRAYARLRDGAVRYVEVPGAGHVVAWNHDPERYEAELMAFVAALEPARRRRVALPLARHLVHRRGRQGATDRQTPPLGAA